MSGRYLHMKQPLSYAWCLFIGDFFLWVKWLGAFLAWESKLLKNSGVQFCHRIEGVEIWWEVYYHLYTGSNVWGSIFRDTVKSARVKNWTFKAKDKTLRTGPWRPSIEPSSTGLDWRKKYDHFSRHITWQHYLRPPMCYSVEDRTEVNKNVIRISYYVQMPRNWPSRPR